MTENLELIKYIRLYLGRTNWEWAKKTSPEELALFQKKSIVLNKSYLVYGTENLLKKFKAFYLARCAKERLLYAQYSMYDYATELSLGTKDDGGLNVDMDLIFLYRHKHQMVTEKAEDWLMDTVLNKVANRNRDGLVTIILSELDMPRLNKSGELKVTNLTKGIAYKSVADAVKDIKNQSTNNDTSYSSEPKTRF